ncbi:MAG: Uncharacterised protein [Flavobacteriales bacterium UBA4585]|nr:MAG: Uncharacterised protein [Flavobacteriales bacterium UBA4585]
MISASSPFQYASQVSGSSSCVALIYPIGASNQTYMTFPSASVTGTGTPQSRSRVMARGCSPSPAFNQLMHCPITLGFQSSRLSKKALNSSDNSSNGKNQFVVLRNSGIAPLKVDFGAIRSVGLNDVPQLSH